MLAHAIETPFIDGSELPRFARPETLAQRPEMRAAAERFQPTPVDEQLQDGAQLDLAGGVQVDGREVAPDQTAYLGTGRAGVDLAPLGAGTTALLLGGRPFGEKVLMWWNFVARTREEVDEAAAQWNAGDQRYGPVTSDLGRIDAPATPWRRDRAKRARG